MARLPPDGLLSHVSVCDGPLFSGILGRSKEIGPVFGRPKRPDLKPKGAARSNLDSEGQRRFDQPKMPCHRSKIAVIVEQWPAVLDAPGSDQEVDGLANGDATPAQGTEITGGRDRDRLAGHRHDVEAAQQALDLERCLFAVEALQHLTKHQIPNDDLFDAQDLTQAPDMRRIPAIEEVDPNAAV